MSEEGERKGNAEKKGEGKRVQNKEAEMILSGKGEERRRGRKKGKRKREKVKEKKKKKED